MGENSKIAWTDHTFNPWWGCTRVSAGCENCYAETFSNRLGYSKEGTKGLPLWGVDSPRREMSEDHWRKPMLWNANARKIGQRARVFCASMADVFELVPERNERAREVMRTARIRLWQLIYDTPWLDWLLLTKRPENVVQLAPWASSGTKRDDTMGKWPSNVWLGTTAEDQAAYDKRWPIIAKVPAVVRFISYEPAIGPLVVKCNGCGEDVRAHLAPDQGGCSGWFPDWVIVGGESGAGARDFHVAWARTILSDSRDGKVFTPFVKQMGAAVVLQPHDTAIIMDRKGDVPTEWPEDLRVQRWPWPR